MRTAVPSGFSLGPWLSEVADVQGCNNTFTFTLDDPPAVEPISVVKDVSCFGFDNGTVQVTGTTGDNPITTYVWSNGDGTANISNLAPGIYTVTLTDTKGCTGSGELEISEPDPLSLSFQVKPVKCVEDSDGEIKAIVQGGTPG